LLRKQRKTLGVHFFAARCAAVSLGRSLAHKAFYIGQCLNCEKLAGG